MASLSTGVPGLYYSVCKESCNIYIQHNNSNTIDYDYSVACTSLEYRITGKLILASALNCLIPKIAFSGRNVIL